LFEGPYEGALSSRANFDITSDGRKFLMLQPTGQQEGSTEMNVMPNWFDEVKRRVAPK